jgi:hypothetical protein
MMNAPYAADVEVATTQAEIPSWMNKLDVEISLLEDLTKRLSPVFNQSGRCLSGSNANVPEPVLCDLAETLRNLTRRIQACNELLNSAQV